MIHYIEEIEVTEEHIGSSVVYIPTHANGNINHPDVEYGKISSFNDVTVFVKYDEGSTGQSTPTHLLIWQD